MNNIILASYFTSVNDPQRGKRWSDEGIDPLLPLINSCKRLKIPIVIFHDCFSFPDRMFIRINTPFNYAPNVYRWLVYDEFLRSNRYDNVFMVDSTDVEVLKSPFDFIEQEQLYSGSEFNMKVDNSWMKNTQAPFVKISDYDDIISRNGGNMLPNCGIVGGSYSIIRRYLIFRECLHKGYSEGVLKSTDMAIHNYIIWKYFKDKLVMGDMINTRFKKYEKNNTAWFRHK